MRKIAICDKDTAVSEKLRDCLLRHPGIGSCDVFSDPRQWFQKPWEDRGAYDVVFMDCSWETEAEGVGTDAKVIYLSSEPEKYIQHLFLRQKTPFGFLIKPVQEELLNRYAKKLMEDDAAPRGCILVRNKGTLQSIRHEDILFLESAGHMVKIWTREGSHSCCYGRLDKFLEQLPEYFIQCHKSYLVNMKAIRCIDRNWILMEQGRLVPISKSRYSETRDKYFRYMGGTIWNPVPKSE